MAEIYSGPDPREQERRRVARIMQEEAEVTAEAARAIRKWTLPMVSNDQCAIFPGDYVAVGESSIYSSRGVFVDMSPDDIASMIESGGLSEVFDTKDLNAPNISDKIDDVMEDIARQRQFKDAQHYYYHQQQYYHEHDHDVDGHALERAVAVFEFPSDIPGEPPATAAVERTGDTFEFVNGAVSEDIPWRECSYEEFNPGGANIIAELRGDEKPEPTENKTSAYERMLEHYEATGGGEPEKPGDAARRIPGYDKMSPSEQLAAQVQLSDEYHKSLERAKSQEKSPDASDQWGPRLPGQRRTGF